MKVSYIELGGRKHPLCFSLSASAKLSDHFGDLDKMQKELSKKDIGTVARAADIILSVLMEAGRKYAKYIGEELPPALECSPADLIDVTDPEAIKAIFAAISGDTERNVEVQSKNADAKQDN